MARPAPRGILAALAIVAVALVAAACGGDGGGEDLSAGLTPAELLARSAEEARGLESFRVAVDLNGRVALAPDSGIPAAGFLDGPLDLSGEGPVQPPDRASIDASVKVGAISPQVNLTVVQDEVFLGLLGQDFRVPLPQEARSLLDLGELYPELTTWVTQPRETGRGEVGGDPTVTIAGEVDAEEAIATLTSAGVLDASARARAGDILERGTIEAAIGTEDLLPRSVRLVLSGDGTSADAGVGAFDIDLTVGFSAFDEPVDIQPPPDARDLDLDQLGSFLGP